MRTIGVAFAVALWASVHVLAGEPKTIEFVWKSKNADVAGTIGTVVRYPVEPGKGAVVIAHGGKPRAVIVLAANPTRSAQIAAAELNHYVEKMTGLRLPVTTDEAWPTSGYKILVGCSALTRALGLSQADFQEQEYLVRTYGNMLVLMGSDEPEYGIIDYQGEGLWPGATVFYDWCQRPQRSKKIGTVYAVDDFLERFCGVRWYMPGELGEVCPKKETLVVGGLDLRRRPWSTYRFLACYTNPEYLAKGGWTRRDVTLWEMRMKMWGIEAYSCNHSLIPQWVARTAEDKDILAQGYERPTQLCLSSEKTLRVVCRDTDEYFAGRTNHQRAHGDYSPVMPHDDGNYCKCPRCQGMLKRPGQEYPGWWTDRASNNVWRFVSEVAGHVKRQHPGKWVCCCSYAGYTLPPEGIEFPDNLAVTCCRVLIDGVDDPEYERFFKERQIGTWSKLARRWYVWEYFDDVHLHWSTGFPRLFTRAIADDVRFLHSLGCRGVFNEFETYLRDSAKAHLNVYVQFKLLDDIDYDLPKGFAEYCKLFYGPAAEPMKKILSRMEEQTLKRRTMQLKPEDRTFDWSLMCSPAVLEELRGLLSQATQRAQAEPYRRRVELFKDEVFAHMEKYARAEANWRRRGTFSLSLSPLAHSATGLESEGSHIPGFLLIGGSPTPTKTEAWVGYDAKNLYVRVKCHEERMESIRATVKPADQSTHGINFDDSVELFVDVGRTRKNYWQMIANANAALYGKWFAADAAQRPLPQPAVSVRKESGFWLMDIRIPLDRLTSGKALRSGDSWGFNICRNRTRPGQETYTCWSPTLGGFHQPTRFGLLRFTAPAGQQ